MVWVLFVLLVLAVLTSIDNSLNRKPRRRYGRH